MTKVLILVFAALTLSACILVPVGHDGDRGGHERHDDRDDRHDHRD